MKEFHTYTDSLPWWAAGILLGLVQVLAVSLAGPLDVSSQFIITDTTALEGLAPEYIENHPIKEHEEYNKSSYGLWLNIGILVGAFFSTLHFSRSFFFNPAFAEMENTNYYSFVAAKLQNSCSN